MSVIFSPQFLFYVLLVVCLFGIAAILTPIMAWSWVGQFYHELWGKFILESVQMISGLVTLGSGYAAATSKADWWPASAAALASTLLWKVAQLAWDWRGKALIKTLENDNKVLAGKVNLVNLNLEFRACLQALFRHAVTEKTERVLKELSDLVPGNASIKHARRALHPKQHLDNMLFDFAVFLRQILPHAEREKYNFRVGLYAEVGGVMKPVVGVSYNNRCYDPFTSYRAHEKHFRLNAADKPTTVVQCVREKRLIIIPDCKEAEKQGAFFYLTKDQEKYLKSIAACCIGEVCSPEGTKHQAAIVIDTDALGYFREDNEEQVRCCIDEFAARISLEAALKGLITVRPIGQFKMDRKDQEARKTEEK